MRRKKMKLKPLPKLILIVILVGLLFTYCESKVKLLPKEYIEENMNIFAQNAVNEVIEKKFSNTEKTYNIVYNQEDLSSIENNTATINKIKSDLTQSINKKLTGNNITWVPIGNLIGIQLLNGYGFKVPVNMYYTGSASVELLSQVNSCGINQSIYSLTAIVNVSICTVSLNNNVIGETYYEYMLCEIVFSGDVPNFVSNLY